MKTNINDQIVSRWTKAAQGLLVGKKIAAVSYLTEEELTELGWDSSCIAIELDDGTVIFASQDDEGNGPGALFTNNDKCPVLPVI